MNKGTLCISLDFEKYWGLHDIVDIREQTNTFKAVSTTVDRLLDLFQAYDIHCTWAVVGLLNLPSAETVKEILSTEHIPYTKPEYSPFHSSHGLEKVDSSLYLAGPEIERIINTENQELASHTFSHYYCMEAGQNRSDFERDLVNFKTFSPQPASSIVFPRNQVNEAYLPICFENGISAYRGNQANRFWKNSNYANESFLMKAGRTLDAYIKLSKDNFTAWSSLQKTNQVPVNIPASRFLRPYWFPAPVEALKLRRIKKQMTKAAKLGKIYHLWWHPHNFSKHTAENFKQLEAILKHYRYLCETYDFQSLTMREIYESLD